MDDEIQKQKLEDYVILPGRSHDDYEYPDVLVGTRLESVESWGRSQQKVVDKNHFILTPRQYLDFWLMLGKGNRLFNKIYLGNGKKAKEEDLDRIREEFLGSGYKIEVLDARFITNYDGASYMLSEHRLRNGLMLPNKIDQVDFSPFPSYSYGHALRKFDKNGLPTKWGIYPGDSWVNHCGYRYNTKDIEGIMIKIPSKGFCPRRNLEESKAIATASNISSGCVGMTMNYADNMDSESEFLLARYCRLKED